MSRNKGDLIRGGAEVLVSVKTQDVLDTFLGNNGWGKQDTVIGRIENEIILLSEEALNEED